MPAEDPDGEEGCEPDSDVVAVADGLGVGERSGEVLTGDDAVLATGGVLDLATVGGAVVRRWVVLGVALGAVTTPTMVGAGAAAGRTWR